MKANEIVIGTSSDNRVYVRLYNPFLDENGYTILEKSLTPEEVRDAIERLKVALEFCEFSQRLEENLNEEKLKAEFESPQQYLEFKAAAELAKTMPLNHTRRCRFGGRPTVYWGGNFEGKFYVTGSTEDDIKNPDAWINGFPAKQVF